MFIYCRLTYTAIFKYLHGKINRAWRTLFTGWTYRSHSAALNPTAQQKYWKMSNHLRTRIFTFCHLGSPGPLTAQHPPQAKASFSSTWTAHLGLSSPNVCQMHSCCWMILTETQPTWEAFSIITSNSNCPISSPSAKPQTSLPTALWLGARARNQADLYFRTLHSFISLLLYQNLLST